MVPKTQRAFDAEAFLNSPGLSRRVADYPPATAIFVQGDAADTVLYIQQGRVKLSVVSPAGKEAVVGVRVQAIFSAKERWPARRFAWRPPPRWPRAGSWWFPNGR